MSDLIQKHITKEKLLFSSTIIINEKYIKYRNIRGIAFILLLIVATPAIYLSNSKNGREDLVWGATNENSPFLYYYVVLIIISVIFGLIHLYTWHQKVIGEIIITDKSIVIKKIEKQYSYRLIDLEEITLSRGSTFHIEDHIGKPYNGDNHIFFKMSGLEKEKLEFRINNEEHSLEFDNLVVFLKSILNSKFNYVSI